MSDSRWAHQEWIKMSTLGNWMFSGGLPPPAYAKANLPPVSFLGCVGCAQCSGGQPTRPNTGSLAQRPSSQDDASPSPRFLLRGGFEEPDEENNAATQDESTSASHITSDSSRPKSAQRNDSLLLQPQDLDTNQSTLEWSKPHPKDLDHLIARLTPFHPGYGRGTPVRQDVQSGVPEPAADVVQPESPEATPVSNDTDSSSEESSEYSFASVSSLSLPRPFLARTPTDIMFGTDHRVSADDDETDYDSVNGLDYSLSEMLGTEGAARAAQVTMDVYAAENEDMRREIDEHVTTVNAWFDWLLDDLWDGTVHAHV